MGILAPLAALKAAPVPNAVAVVSLEDAAKSGGQVQLPEGAIRLAVSVKVILADLYLQSRGIGVSFTCEANTSHAVS